MTGFDRVVVDHVERHYSPTTHVGPVSLSIAAGRCLGLVGSNGAGKTTLMRIVVGLDRPDQGTVHVNGTPVHPGRPTPGVSGMIEEPRFYPGMSGRDNLYVMCGGRQDRRDRISALLHLVGLDHATSQRVSGYSQGMRQRLGIARVLLAEPTSSSWTSPPTGWTLRGSVGSGS